MNSKFPIVRMYTDERDHTRFAKMNLPLIEKTGLGSVGLFSSLFVNPNVFDNSGDLRLQFAITPSLMKPQERYRNWLTLLPGNNWSLPLGDAWSSKVVMLRFINPSTLPS